MKSNAQNEVMVCHAQDVTLPPYYGLGAYGGTNEPVATLPEYVGGTIIPVDINYLYLNHGPAVEHIISSCFEISRGANGAVYQATLDRKPVALKVPHKGREEDIKNEIRIYQQLKELSSEHQNYVAELYSAFVLNDIIRAAFRYFEFGNLKTVLNKKELTPAIRENFCLQFISCVAFVHKLGLIHADIKAENVLVDKDFKLRLADMGCAFFNNEDTKSFGGDPWYRSPQMLVNTHKYENAKSKGNADPTKGLRTIEQVDDVYSSALVLHHMLSGQVPFQQYITNKAFPSFYNRLTQHNMRPRVKALKESQGALLKSMWQANESQRPSMSDVEAQMKSLKK